MIFSLLLAVKSLIRARISFDRNFIAMRNLGGLLMTFRFEFDGILLKFALAALIVVFQR